MKYLAKDLNRVLTEVEKKAMKIPKKTSEALNYWYRETQGRQDIDDKYFDFNNITFYKKDDIRECKHCEVFLFSWTQGFRVDGNNIAITKNARMQCVHCEKYV